jgi:hypothetical protein
MVYIPFYCIWKGGSAMSGDYQERRMLDVESTHSFSKNAAQAMILVNGGAVTAMFASQSVIVEHVLTGKNSTVATALMLFSFGVLCGVLMHWCERQALYHFGQKWQWLADLKNKGINKDVAEIIDRHESNGERWHLFSTILFIFSGLLFVGGCVSIASLMWTCDRYVFWCMI